VRERISGGAPDPHDVLTRLQDRFGPLEKPRLDPLDELVLTILSQSTTDTNRDRAWDNLRQKFPPAPESARLVSWETVHGVADEALAEVIRVAGLAGQKTAAIRGVLARLVTDFGRPTLDHLRDMADADALAYLTEFRGVGVKTAACVLCFSLRRPLLPVDTHVHRIAKRLSWVPEAADATTTHRLLQPQVPADDRFPLHLQLITLGRKHCTARNPACDACPISLGCPRVGV